MHPRHINHNDDCANHTDDTKNSNSRASAYKLDHNKTHIYTLKQPRWKKLLF